MTIAGTRHLSMQDDETIALPSRLAPKHEQAW
jgi:hypothetical protein